MIRVVYSKSLADKWCKIGYTVTALSYFGYDESPMAYHLVKKL